MPRSWLVFIKLGNGSSHPLPLLSVETEEEAGAAEVSAAAEAAGPVEQLWLQEAEAERAAVDLLTVYQAQEALATSNERLCVEKELVIVTEMASVSAGLPMWPASFEPRSAQRMVALTRASAIQILQTRQHEMLACTDETERRAALERLASSREVRIGLQRLPASLVYCPGCWSASGATYELFGQSYNKLSRLPLPAQKGLPDPGLTPVSLPVCQAQLYQLRLREQRVITARVTNEAVTERAEISRKRKAIFRNEVAAAARMRQT